MPRISAPTVAEHHARQHGALVAVARRVLLDEGLEAVTPGRVGKEAGLARSSVYTYFPSTAVLLAEIVEDSFRSWAGVVAESVDAGTDAADRLHRYVRATLELAAAGEHRVASLLAPVELPPACRERLAVLHRDLEAPLRTALAELGAPDLDVAVSLAQGAIDGAVRAIDDGADGDTLVAATVRFVVEGVGALRRP